MVRFLCCFCFVTYCQVIFSLHLLLLVTLFLSCYIIYVLFCLFHLVTSFLLVLSYYIVFAFSLLINHVVAHFYLLSYVVYILLLLFHLVMSFSSCFILSTKYLYLVTYHLWFHATRWDKSLSCPVIWFGLILLMQLSWGSVVFAWPHVKCKQHLSLIQFDCLCCANQWGNRAPACVTRSLWAF